jgi:hypothetical protein
MKVKIFDGLTQGGANEAGIGSLEKEINEWLAANPDIEILDVRLAMTSYPAEEYSKSIYRFPTVCLIFYKEK